MLMNFKNTKIDKGDNMKYCEDKKSTMEQRKDYLDSIEKLIENKQSECRLKREKYIKKIILIKLLKTI